MDAMQWKRNAIEHGLLSTWERRGRGAWRAEKHRLVVPLLRAALRVTGLRSRGERNALNPVVRGIRFACDRLPEGFCGFTILHLSDLHVDGVEGVAEGLSAHLQDLEVDLCVLTGDYRFTRHGPCDDVYPNMARILSGVNARLGIVGILGNHDLSGDVPALEHLWWEDHSLRDNVPARRRRACRQVRQGRGARHSLGPAPAGVPVHAQRSPYGWDQSLP